MRADQQIYNLVRTLRESLRKLRIDNTLLRIENRCLRNPYLYAYEYTSCVHESAFEVISLHRTFKAAYLAKRKAAYEDAVTMREAQIRYGGWKGQSFTMEARRVRLLVIQ